MLLRLLFLSLFFQVQSFTAYADEDVCLAEENKLIDDLQNPGKELLPSGSKNIVVVFTKQDENDSDLCMFEITYTQRVTFGANSFIEFVCESEADVNLKKRKSRQIVISNTSCIY